MSNSNATSAKTKNYTLIILICITLVSISGIGAWVYVNQKSIEQDQKRLQQEKRLKEFEQSQINERTDKDRACESDSAYLRYTSCR